jgi:hypothetical protein
LRFNAGSLDSDSVLDLEFDDISKNRAKAFPEQMNKAGDKLRKQNMKKKDMEDKVFEVIRDPNDGALYLHIDPADLNKYSAKELKEMS